MPNRLQVCLSIHVNDLKFEFSMWATTCQNQQSDCAPSEDSDQPGHPPSLIRVFAVRMKKPWGLSYSFSAQRRLWSDWADTQADLSLRWAHTHSVGFDMSWLMLCCFVLFVVSVFFSFLFCAKLIAFQSLLTILTWCKNTEIHVLFAVKMIMENLKQYAHKEESYYAAVRSVTRYIKCR